jgi:hypothetical protein
LAGRFFFQFMDSKSTCATTGGSLPRISPELLWFESHEHGAPARALVLPNGDVVFAHRQVVYVMPEPEWRQFEAYLRAA